MVPHTNFSGVFSVDIHFSCCGISFALIFPVVVFYLHSFPSRWYLTQRVGRCLVGTMLLLRGGICSSGMGRKCGKCQDTSKQTKQKLAVKQGSRVNRELQAVVYGILCTEEGAGTMHGVWVNCFASQL